MRYEVGPNDWGWEPPEALLVNSFAIFVDKILG